MFIEFPCLQLIFYVLYFVYYLICIELFTDVTFFFFLSQNKLMNKVLVLFHFTDGETKSQVGEVTCGRFWLIVTSWAWEACVLRSICSGSLHNIRCIPGLLETSQNHPGTFGNGNVSLCTRHFFKYFVVVVVDSPMRSFLCLRPVHPVASRCPLSGTLDSRSSPLAHLSVLRYIVQLHQGHFLVPVALVVVTLSPPYAHTSCLAGHLHSTVWKIPKHF